MRARGLAAPLDGGRVLLAIGLLGAAWGMAVAAGGLISLYLCASLIACGFILFDFRIDSLFIVGAELARSARDASSASPRRRLGSSKESRHFVERTLRR